MTTSVGKYIKELQRADVQEEKVILFRAALDPEIDLIQFCDLMVYVGVLLP